MSSREVVITGLGVVSPIGIGKQSVWEGFSTGRNGVHRIELFDPSGLPIQIAGEVRDFDPKQFVKPRKNLKVMLRDAQLGVAASIMACEEAGVAIGNVDPDRVGVIFGADRMSGPLDDSGPAYRRCMPGGRFDFDLWGPEGMPEIFPLSFLRVLPNMIASHISIVHDARGPNNTIHQAEVSGLLAIGEAVRVIERGAADVMLAGAATSAMNPYDWVGHCGLGRLSARKGDPADVLCPFDARRDGEVHGEGGAVFVLETRKHAEARGAEILARVLGCTSACEVVNGRGLVHGTGLRRAMSLALQEAGLQPNEIGHVNAHGASTVAGDALEAKAIRDVLPDVPVTAPKSYFGSLGAGGGAVEMVASVLALVHGKVPATRNYEKPDPECPIPVVQGDPQDVGRRTAMLVNFTGLGQAAAVVLGGAD